MTQKSVRFYTIAALLAVFAVIANASAGKPKSPAPLDVLNMASVPDGTYEVTLEIEDNTVHTEFRVRRGIAKCVKSDKAPEDREILGAFGSFSLIANGVIVIQLRAERYAASQFWASKPDGAAEIKELPDRGEIQKAVRIQENQ